MTTPRLPDPDVSAYDANVAHLAKTTTTHTPGPWFVEKATDGTLWVTLGSTPRYIAKCGLATVDGNPANARLIAQAPAMLQLVRLIAHGAERPFDHPDKRALCKSAAEARAILRAIEDHAV
jgi:hypothetical protein